MKCLFSFIIAISTLVLLSHNLYGNEDASYKSNEFKSNLNFSTKELEWLKKNESITYVYDPDWAPFEWKNELDLHTGIIADIIDLIKKKSGINLVAVHTETWKESVDLVKSKKVDMFSAITQNDFRKTYLNFTSKDIYTYPAVIITKFDDKKVYLSMANDFKGKKIGIVKSSGLGRYIKETYPNLDYVELASTGDGFKSVQNKKIDMFAINTVAAKYYIEKKGFDDLKIALKLDYIYHLNMAVRKGMPSEIISILDKSLNSITEQELNNIFSKWTEVSIEKQTDWTLLIEITVVLFFIILTLLWSNKNLNKKVEARTIELEEANLELKKINEEKNVILGIAAHDIRNPLGVILNSALLLKNERLGDLNEKQIKFATTIYNRSKHMRSLLENILDMSAIESGRLTLRFEEFVVNELVEDVVTDERIYANKKNIEIELSFDFEELIIKADKMKLHQVLSNIISNAIKYSPHKTNVKVHSKLSHENVEVSVVDQGQGVSEADIEKLFKPFETTQNKPTGNESSTGLGLAISNKIIEAHQGKIQVESQVGKGSTFIISLPLRF